MGQPLVSIVTPSYQQGEYIEDTIQSVARQSYDRIEHIVVDGGSTDDTVEILSKYADRYELRWQSEADDGQSDALNKGFAMANGEIVGWVNSDDFYYDDEAVATAVEQFESDPDLDVLYGGIAYVDQNGRIESFQPPVRFDSDVLRGHDYVPQPGVFFNAEVVVEQPLRTDLVFAMDYEYWLRLSDAGYRIAVVPKIMAAYRRHEQTKGEALGLERLREEQAALRETYGSSPRGKELLFKTERNLREVAWNLRKYRARGRLPPVLRSTRGQ